MCWLDHVPEVHAVELVAGEDQDEARAVVESKCTRFCRTASAVPWYQSVLSKRLLGGEDLDEAAAEVVELVGAGDVPVERAELNWVRTKMRLSPELMQLRWGCR